MVEPDEAPDPGGWGWGIPEGFQEEARSKPRPERRIGVGQVKVQERRSRKREQSAKVQSEAGGETWWRQGCQGGEVGTGQAGRVLRTPGATEASGAGSPWAGRSIWKISPATLRMKETRKRKMSLLASGEP